MPSTDVVVVGAGQAGLAASQQLTERGTPHVVLEQGRIGETWRSQRWDSFTLVTPNWTLDLPGFPYAGDDPDGFLTRDEWVAHLEAYARSFGAPVHEGVRVRALRAAPSGHEVETDAGTWSCRAVIVAAGGQRVPNVPALAARLPPRVRQVHAADYRSPAQLPPSAVLVVGSGQSGCQIAEELREAGREVWLSVGRCGRLPRRHRGRDIMWWAHHSGLYDLQAPPGPPGGSACSPHVSGRDGGRDVHLRALAATGVRLVGKLVGVEEERVLLADDVARNVEGADAFAQRVVEDVERRLLARGLPLPPGSSRVERHPPAALDARRALRLDEARVASVVWATGFRPDFSWIRDLPLEADGSPRHEAGESPVPGLYFLGLPWLAKMKSGIILGVKEDAARVVARVTEALADDEPDGRRRVLARARPPPGP